MENTFQPDVLCVGQAVIDCITRGQEEKPYKENVWRAESIRLSTGGDAVNESFALSSMGHRVSLVCGVGNDLAGSILLSEAEKRGICTKGVTVSDSLTTPIADLIVRMDGSRYSINSGATKLEGYTPDPSVLRESGAKIISFASLFRAPLDDPETVLLLDVWRDQAAIDAHHNSPMMADLAALRVKYDLHMTAERYQSIDAPAADAQFLRK